MAAPRLVLLNGAPGVGKSTMAERYAAEDPRCVLVDIDRLRRDLPDDPAGPESARAQGLSLAAAALSAGSDVVVPQLVARVDQLVRFEQVARGAAADFVHLLLVDDGDDPVARFHRRRGADPWHAAVRAVVGSEGGDAVLERYLAGLDEVRSARTDLRVVRSVEGDPDGTWAALRDVLG